MLYMIIERFKNRDPVPVYRRFRDKGRMAPEGLAYVSSWVTEDMDRCYQVMECVDRRILEEWMTRWSDVTDFGGDSGRHLGAGGRADRSPTVGRRGRRRRASRALAPAPGAALRSGPGGRHGG